MPLQRKKRGGVESTLIPNFAKLLKILKLDTSNWVILKKPMRFQNIILPDEAFFSNPTKNSVMFSNEYLDMIEEIKIFMLKNYRPLSQKNFYLFYGGRSFGEERTANYFHTKGFAVIRPEKLPLEEQLNIFMNCTNFASTIGSCSHNVVFLKDFSNLHLIPRSSLMGLNGRQLAINHIPYIKNTYYLDTSLSVFVENIKGPFCYIISENLRKHFGDKVTGKYTDEDFATFLSYVRYSKMNGLKENPQELRAC